MGGTYLTFLSLIHICEIYHSLGKILSQKGMATSVGDEGGFAPNLETDEEAIELIIQAVCDVERPAENGPGMDL